MWVARPGPRVLRHDVHCAVSRGSAGAASRGGPESPALSHENVADSQENITRRSIFSQKYPWGPGNTLIRHLEWLPGHGPPAVGWGWTSRLRYRGFPTAPPFRRAYCARSHGACRSLTPKLRGGARSDGRLLGTGELLLPSVTLTMSGGRTRRRSPSVPSVLSASSLPLRAPSGRAVHRRLPSVPSVFFPPALRVLPHGGSHVSASLATRAFADMRHRPFLCGETTSAGSDRRVSGQAARSRGRRGQA